MGNWRLINLIFFCADTDVETKFPTLTGQNWCLDHCPNQNLTSWALHPLQMSNGVLMPFRTWESGVNEVCPFLCCPENKPWPSPHFSHCYRKFFWWAKKMSPVFQLCSPQDTMLNQQDLSHHRWQEMGPCTSFFFLIRRILLLLLSLNHVPALWAQNDTFE